MNYFYMYDTQCGFQQIMMSYKWVILASKKIPVSCMLKYWNESCHVKNVHIQPIAIIYPQLYVSSTLSFQIHLDHPVSGKEMEMQIAAVLLHYTSPSGV